MVLTSWSYIMKNYPQSASKTIDDCTPFQGHIETCLTGSAKYYWILKDNGSEIFWSQNLFRLIKIIDNTKELLFMCIMSVNIYCIRN